MSRSKTFKAKILDAGNGMDAAFVKIPFDVKDAFGGMRPKIMARFDNKVDYRGSLVRMGTPYHILLMRKDVRAELGKGVGDIVNVKVELDTKPRVVDVPENLKKAFARAKKAEKFFNSLSYSHQKEYVQYITEAKKEETRIRRLRKVMEMLKDEVKTPK